MIVIEYRVHYTLTGTKHCKVKYRIQLLDWSWTDLRKVVISIIILYLFYAFASFPLFHKVGEGNLPMSDTLRQFEGMFMCSYQTIRLIRPASMATVNI